MSALIGGLVSVTFRQLSPAAVVELTTQAGLAAIEWGGDVHVPPGEAARAEAVGRLTRAAGLTVAAYGSYYRAGQHDSSPFAAVLESAAALGAPRIRIWAGTQASADATPADWARIVADTQRIADQAQQAGIGVVFEFHRNTLTDSSATARRLLAEVDHPNVKSYWQPPRGLSADENLAGLELLAPWLDGLHVFSWDKTTYARLPLAAHAADWQHYLAWAAQLERPLPVLLEFVQDDDPHNFQRDAALFNTWLAAPAQAAPSSTPTLRTFFFADDGAIPNNPLLPLLVYPGALDLPPGADPAHMAEQLFTGNGWGKTWRNGIYPYHHYHSTAHEVLAICRGQAKVQFGGEQGTVLTVQAGDVVVIPAGCGHKNLGSGPEFLVVGAYPPGQSPDMGYGRPEERQRLVPNIVNVPLPATDPVYGRHGPLLTHWR